MHVPTLDEPPQHGPSRNGRRLDELGGWVEPATDVAHKIRDQVIALTRGQEPERVLRCEHCTFQAPKEACRRANTASSQRGHTIAHTHRCANHFWYRFWFPSRTFFMTNSNCFSMSGVTILRINAFGVLRRRRDSYVMPDTPPGDRSWVHSVLNSPTARAWRSRLTSSRPTLAHCCGRAFHSLAARDASCI